MGFGRAGTFTAEPAVVNHGRYPVKIAGFPQKGAYYYGLERVEMVAGAGGLRQPFRSFSAAAGRLPPPRPALRVGSGDQ